MTFFRPNPFAGALNIASKGSRGAGTTLAAPLVPPAVVEEPFAGYVNIKSYDMDGVNDYIDTGVKPADLEINGDNDKSIGFHVNWTNWATNRALVSMGEGSSEADLTCRARSGTAGQYRLNHWGTDIDFDVAGSVGNWKHLAFVYKTDESGLGSDSVFVYVNGSEVATGAVSFNTSNANNIVIGRNVVYDDHYPDAFVDEFCIFNTALTAGEVSELYNSGTTFDVSEDHSKKANLKLYYSFDAGDATDDSGNESAGTVNGGAFSSTVP
tara:strand:+ start:137 stop:940 length:804 start_codon:yes stop_codon:yes gene_type:complete